MVDDKLATLEQEEPTLTEVLKETALLPVRIATSKAALKTYFGTILLVISALTLYAISVTAYVFFYYNYIPNLSFSTPIHFQFDHSRDAITNRPAYHPHGISSITSTSASSSSTLVSLQRYDLTVRLSLPRSPTNIEAGNFMVSLSLLGPSSNLLMPPYAPTSVLAMQEPNSTVLATSSRPTTLTYASPGVELARKFLVLPMYLIGWRHESETLEIPMMDGVSFERGWRNIPSTVWVEVRSRERLQFYSCDVEIRATLSGFRWLMYKYRVICFFVFTTLFWAVEMTTALMFWLAASFIFSGARKLDETLEVKSPDKPQRIKREDEEDDDLDNLSDTDRTFPTYARQPPLRYSSPPKPHVKQEEDETAVVLNKAGEADVSASDPSDEDADFVLDEPESMRRRDYDSGLGTSMESSSGGSNLRRRQSGGRK